MFRVQNPEGKIGRLCGQIYAGIPLPQNLLLPLAIDRDAGDMGGDFRQAHLLRLRSAFLLAVHRKGAEHFTLCGQNRRRPARAQAANARELTIIDPEWIGHYIGHYYWPAREHGRAARAISRPDRRAVHRFNVRFR